MFLHLIESECKDLTGNDEEKNEEQDQYTTKNKALQHGIEINRCYIHTVCCFCTLLIINHHISERQVCGTRR